GWADPRRDRGSQGADPAPGRQRRHGDPGRASRGDGDDRVRSRHRTRLRPRHRLRQRRAGAGQSAGDRGLLRHWRRRVCAPARRRGSEVMRDAGMGEALLKVEGLKVAYGRIEAVRGVDLEVQAGEFVGIIGSNGAGKTSALRAIAGVVAPAGGSITFDGAATTGLPSPAVGARRIAVGPAGPQIFADQTVEDNLILGAYLRIGKDDAGVAEDMTRVFGLFPLLKERREQLAGSLSGGEQQMLAIARGLLSRPKLLVVDELSLGLAPK